MIDSERRSEVDDLDSGADPRMVLRRRVDRARVDKNQALVELREVMSDQEALDRFGIDVTQG